MINFVYESDKWLELLPNIEDISSKAIGFAAGDMSVVLADDAFIQGLNNQFRGQDKPTNVLSFPSSEDDYLGDIIIALETLQREAQEQCKSLEHHFTHMLIHGALHLMGYDHIENDDAKLMESKEIQLLAELDIANPYIHV